MNDLLHNLIEALREELKQYGEMLAVLEQQQQAVMQRQTGDVLQNVAEVNAQSNVIAAVRHEREQHRRNVARMLDLDDNAGFAVIIPQLPADYRPLVQALVSENNALLVRIQQRARQNHLLLSHAVEMLQQLMNAVFPGGAPRTYDSAGRLPQNLPPRQSIYEQVC
ncbi:MAG TPA: flagellar export chaperone FlgN [Verrucomicrobiae bacterium]|jgi:flagellar biosynthesis/type III secretory pathway chaperone|nr:flagellar export chaperone FlgN [Verrucomicrobiae bacterium]